MNEEELNLNKFINELDPFNMMIYKEYDIYQKETKLILKNKLNITTGYIKDIFKIGFDNDIDEDNCTKIKDYVLNTRGRIYNYQYFDIYNKLNKQKLNKQKLNKQN